MPPWACAALGMRRPGHVCAREACRCSARRYWCLTGAEQVPGERRSSLRGGRCDSGACGGGGLMGGYMLVFESRWHSSQRGRYA